MDTDKKKANLKAQAEPKKEIKKEIKIEKPQAVPKHGAFRG